MHELHLNAQPSLVRLRVSTRSHLKETRLLFLWPSRAAPGPFQRLLKLAPDSIYERQYQGRCDRESADYDFVNRQSNSEPDMRIRQLSQPKADVLMKSLEGVYFKNWSQAFHEERNLPRTGMLALPEDKRIYFLIESYLVGVFSGNAIALSLSSFARVLDQHPAGKCATCLQVLLETRLFPMCLQQGKTQIVAKLEPDGARVFQELKCLIPGIQLTRGFYWNALVPVPPSRSGSP